MRAVLFITFATLSPVFAEGLSEGTYRIEHRSEFPHLERHSQSRTTTLCLREPPWPIIGAVGAFRDCTVSGMDRSDTATTYSIACGAVAGPRASAVYKTKTDRFTARIRIKLGAKNMTFDEIQEGVRTGPCEPDQ